MFPKYLENSITNVLIISKIKLYQIYANTLGIDFLLIFSDVRTIFTDFCQNYVINYSSGSSKQNWPVCSAVMAACIIFQFRPAQFQWMYRRFRLTVSGGLKK